MQWHLLPVFWILDEVWRAGDGIAAVATTGIEANFIGISTNAPSQTFINVCKSKVKNCRIIPPYTEEYCSS
jgi:hypothetical protein